MNRKATPLLLAAALILGLVAWWSNLARKSSSSDGAPRGARLLSLHPQDLIQVRVRRDYWNTFTLARGRDTRWELIEPAREPADPEAVERLLQTLTTIPVLQRIDLPGDDTERHRQYGLWEPRLTVQILTAERQESLLFGGETSDGAGIYCAREGRDGVFIVPADALAVLETGPDPYRAAPGSDRRIP
jgi:hypothetical protein